MTTWQALMGVKQRLDRRWDMVTVLVDDSNLVLPRLFEAATQHSARITSVDIREPNLEAVFLHLTGRSFELHTTVPVIRGYLKL